jgi:hypothetical protein
MAAPGMGADRGLWGLPRAIASTRQASPPAFASANPAAN